MGGEEGGDKEGGRGERGRGRRRERRKGANTMTKPFHIIHASPQRIEHLEPSVLGMYREFVKLYEEARETAATPQCLHPADVPTIKFLVQLIFHMCSHPVSVCGVVVSVCVCVVCVE